MYQPHAQTDWLGSEQRRELEARNMLLNTSIHMIRADLESITRQVQTIGSDLGNVIGTFRREGHGGQEGHGGREGGHHYYHHPDLDAARFSDMMATVQANDYLNLNPISNPIPASDGSSDGLGSPLPEQPRLRRQHAQHFRHERIRDDLRARDRRLVEHLWGLARGLRSVRDSVRDSVEADLPDDGGSGSSNNNANDDNGGRGAGMGRLAEHMHLALVEQDARAVVATVLGMHRALVDLGLLEPIWDLGPDSGFEQMLWAGNPRARAGNYGDAGYDVDGEEDEGGDDESTSSHTMSASTAREDEEEEDMVDVPGALLRREEDSADEGVTPEAVAAAIGVQLLPQHRRANRGRPVQVTEDSEDLEDGASHAA